VEPESLEERVTALESQVRELADRVRASEQDAAAARVLAGGADRDVNVIRGEIRDFRQATVSTLDALRGEMNERFVQVDSRFDEMRGRLDQHTGWLRAVDEQLLVVKDLIIDRLGSPAGT
jgi:hypothetical protein